MPESVLSQVPILRRDVFLDNVAEVEPIVREIRRLADKARRNGGAVGIPDVTVDLEDGDLNDYSLPQPEDDCRDALRASMDFIRIGNPDVLLPLWAAIPPRALPPPWWAPPRPPPGDTERAQPGACLPTGGRLCHTAPDARSSA